MKDKLVSYETAVLAKEKEFEEDCLGSFNSDNGYELASDFTGSLYITQEDIRNAWDNEYLCYLAPTQSLLQRWLREKHRIHIEPNYDYLKQDYSYTIIKTIKNIIGFVIVKLTKKY